MVEQALTITTPEQARKWVVSNDDKRSFKGMDKLDTSSEFYSIGKNIFKSADGTRHGDHYTIPRLLRAVCKHNDTQAELRQRLHNAMVASECIAQVLRDDADKARSNMGNAYWRYLYSDKKRNGTSS